MDFILEAGGALQLRTNTGVDKQVELWLAKTLLCSLALGLVRFGVNLLHICPKL